MSALARLADELLTINNSATCPLLIFDIAGSAGFLAPSVLSYPVLVGPANSVRCGYPLPAYGPLWPEGGRDHDLKQRSGRASRGSRLRCACGAQANLIIAIEDALAFLEDQTELPLTFARPTSVDTETILRAHTPALLARLDVPEDFDEDTPFFRKHCQLRPRVRGRRAGCACAPRARRNCFQPHAPARPSRHARKIHGLLLFQQHRHRRAGSARHRRKTRRRF